MKISTILTVDAGDIIGALRRFLSDLLESGVFNALLVPQETAQGRSLAPMLVSDPDSLNAANPLSPVMPLNFATLVSRLTIDKPRRKLGAVLRSCELRALIELVKLRQADLGNLTTIGVDCLGTYELEDYARMIEGMEGEAEEKGRRIIAEMRGQVALPSSIPLRTACQICEYPITSGADITVGIIGLEDGVLVELESELAAKLGLEEGKVPGREEAVTKLIEARTTERERAFAEFREKAKSIADFADQFATCTGCYNCSTACPICFCKECFFRTATFSPESERYFRWAERVGALRLPTEVLLYQLTRLNHMVASCVGCGLCQSACPQNLPLTTIFRTIGEGVQKMLGYVPGRSVAEELPIATFKEEVLTL